MSNSAAMKTGLTPIASAVALMLACAAMPAAAQQAAPAQTAPSATAPATAGDTANAQAATAAPQEVVVSGIRASLQQALARKRNSDSVSEVISAEDIGKLPDKNVADAIQRVPGVNISSLAGGEGGFSENDRV